VKCSTLCGSSATGEITRFKGDAIRGFLIGQRASGGTCGPLEQARKSDFTSARLNQARWSERGMVWSAFSVAFLYSVPSVGTFRQIPAKRFAEASHVMATRPMCTTSVASSPMICTPISFKSS